MEIEREMLGCSFGNRAVGSPIGGLSDQMRQGPGGAV